MKIELQIQRLRPRQEFRISRGRKTEVPNVFLKVESGGVFGWGEASPNSYYGENAETVVAKLEQARDWLESLEPHAVEDIERAWQESWRFLAPSRAAQCALDVALWDFLGRKLGASVCELVWGRKPAPVTSFCTIGLCSEGELAAKTEELRSHPLVKIKSDASADLRVVQYVKERCGGGIAVDANAAWSAADLRALCSRLSAMGVLFVEQPLPPEDNAPMSAYDLPVIADESCVLEEDVERVLGRFSGFNIKLVKCGGLTPALRMLRRGRDNGSKVMVGCMLESSLLIAAGAVIAQQSDYADLDGAWLLKEDPFIGGRFERGLLDPTSGPGLGVRPLIS